MLFRSVAITVKNNLESNLETAISDANGAFQFGNKTKNKLDNLIKSLVDSVHEIVQKISTEQTQTQELKGNGGTTISLVTMTQAGDMVSKLLQANTVIEGHIADLSSEMLEGMDNSQGWINAVIIIVSILVVGGLIALGINLASKKKGKKGAATVELSIKE